jgi:hypothetical protein
MVEIYSSSEQEIRTGTTLPGNIFPGNIFTGNILPGNIFPGNVLGHTINSCWEYTRRQAVYKL